MLVTLPCGDILEMNISKTPPRSNQTVMLTVRRGGHMQRIANTQCSSKMVAHELLVWVAEELRQGISVLGTSNGQPVLITEGAVQGVNEFKPFHKIWEGV